MSKTKKIVNMLADDTAAPVAARTLAKAAEQEGKLISDYLMERLQHDHAPPTSASDIMKAAAPEARERRQSKDEKFVPTEPRPSYKEPGEVTAMVLAYKEQIEFLDRLKLVVKAMKGLPPDTNFAKALAAAIAEGARALKALEKEQEPMIAAGIAARKASTEAYAIAFRAWAARMKRERTRSEEARREKL
ncbi:MAG: hypothetical protein ACLP1D_06655 [Xanthobacteraceae bacterium]